MSTRKHSLIASIAVMGSRVAGLVREVVFAYFFGASGVLDAFIAAFRIPNLLRDLFSEGALSTAFVTVFSKKSVREGDDAAWSLANKVFLFLLYTLGLICLLGIIFSPVLVHLVASGFEGEKFDLTVRLNRLLFPFILFVSFAAVAMGMLNSKGKFALPQSASTFFNVSSIVIGLAVAWLMAPDAFHNPTWDSMTRAITGMAIGTLSGGLIQWLVQMPPLFKMGFRFHWAKLRNDAALKEVLLLTIPAIIGGSAVQINVLINSNFASYLADGSMAWLNYAFRLMQFPIGVFGVAIATATTPALSRLLAEGKKAELSNTLRDSTQMALYLCIPSALGLMLFSEPIIHMIYQHGRFSTNDTLQTAHALNAYAAGLSFYAIIKIFQPAFLAFDRARTPMIISLCSIAMNAGLNALFVFVFHFNHWGLALGTSLVACTNCLLLMFFFNRQCQTFAFDNLTGHLLKTLITAALATLMGRGIWELICKTGWNSHFLPFVFLLLATVLLVGLFYLLLGSAFKIQESTLAWNWINRKLKRPSRF